MGFVNCLSTFNNFRLLTCSLCYKGASIYYLKAQFHPFISLNVVLKISKICYFVSCSSCVQSVHFRSLWDWKPFRSCFLFVLQTTVFYFVHSPFLTICQFSLLFMDFSLQFLDGLLLPFSSWIFYTSSIFYSFQKNFYHYSQSGMGNHTS